MAIFCVIAKEPNPELSALVSGNYAGSLAYSDRAWLVPADISAKALAESLGVSEPDADGNGTSRFGDLLVAQISASYWGWGSSDLWNWLKSQFERGA